MEKIVKKLLQQVKEGISFQVNDLTHLREHFSTLGAASSIELYKELLELLDSSESKSRIYALQIIDYFIRHVNILSNAGLRDVIRTGTPAVISKLWKDKLREEGARLARSFAYVLLLEQNYLESGNAEEIWKEIITKTMKKCPIMALLTIMLSGTNADDWASSTLRTFSFSPADDATTFTFLQFVEIVKQHKEILLQLDIAASTNILLQVMKYGCLKTSGEENHIEKTVTEFLRNRQLKSRPDITSRVIFCSAVSAIAEIINDKKGWQKLAPWLTDASLLLSSFPKMDDSLQMVKAEGFTERFQAMLADSAKVFAKGTPDIIKDIFIALNQIPFDLLSLNMECRIRDSFLILAGVFYKCEHISLTCIAIISKLLNKSKTFSNSVLSKDYDFKILVDQWTVYVQNNCTKNNVEDFISILTGMQKASTLNYGDRFAHLPSDKDKINILHLVAFCRSSPWRELISARGKDKRQLQELKALIESLVDVVTFEEPRDSLIEGYIFDVLVDMNKEEKVALLDHLLGEEQVNRLYDLAVKILKRKIHVDGRIISQALSFCIYISTGTETNDAHNISQLFKWPILCAIQEKVADRSSYFYQLIPPRDCLKLLLNAGKHLNKNPNAVISIAKFLAARIPSAEYEKLPNILASFIDFSNIAPMTLDLCAEFLKISGGGSSEQKVVLLSFAIASRFIETESDLQNMIMMQNLLFNSLRYSSSSVTNDQVSVFLILLTDCFRRVQNFGKFKTVDDETLDNLKYKCAEIVYLMSKHDIYFKRAVFSIISETLLLYEELPLAMFRLHSLVDKHTSSLLAVTLPPREKRKYGRLLPGVKKLDQFLV